MDLTQLASLVVNNPSLQAVHLNQLLLFFAVVSSLRDNLLLIQPSEHAACCPPIVHGGFYNVCMQDPSQHDSRLLESVQGRPLACELPK